MFSNHYHSVAKRIKTKHEQDKAYLHKWQTVPKQGYTIDKDTAEKEKGIVFYVPEEEEYFHPDNKKLLNDPFKIYKAGLIVDRVYNIKRLKEPDRWCVFPKSETVVVEVPLTKQDDYGYRNQAIQEIGHVAWHKATFYVDKESFQEKFEDVEVKQVLSKVYSKGLPRWKKKTRYWDDDFVGYIEVPGTIFCTEQALIKKIKYFQNQGYTPEVVHTRDISHTVRDTIGCSILRRHQPPAWTYNRPYNSTENEERNKIWNGLENRNQWVFQSLYTIWAGEEAVPDNDHRERVFWTGPTRFHNCDDYFKCYYEPYCQDTVKIEEEVEPSVVESVVDDNEYSTVW